MIRLLSLSVVILAVWIAVEALEPIPADPAPHHAAADTTPARRLAQARKRIRHVVIIMQENRSFDSYFGTYPGAEGIPMEQGRPVPCLPWTDPERPCTRPYHDRHDINRGAPHTTRAHLSAVNGGRLDGFIKVAERGAPKFHPVDVMGWHDAREIPNYWAYARHFVLQDHMFEPVRSWSMPAHLFMVSAWSAICRDRYDAKTCVNAVDGPVDHYDNKAAWTDLTYLLHRRRVSWRYYVFSGREPDCPDGDERVCPRRRQKARTLSFWNPLPGFATVRRNRQIRNIQETRRFYAAA